MDFRPAAGEIGNLWNMIMSNQAHLCLLEHWLFHVEDEGVKEILLRSKDEAQSIIQQSLAFYHQAGFPSPIGFKIDKDVVPSTPKLMSDKLVLIVLQILSEYGVYGYGLTVGKTETPEVLAFIRKCLSNASDLYQSITELMHKKGYNHQIVYIPTPQHAELVDNKSYLSGWFGEQRPVNALEIDNLVFSLRGVILAKTFYLVFSQIATDTKVQKYCKKGRDLCSKRVEKLQALSASEHLPFHETYETEVTNSPTSPFSERLIMFEALSLAQIAIARYGNALSSVIRRDLNTLFALLIAETGPFLDEGLRLMIDKEWFEQPPMTAER